jgi:peptidoglycan/LPS O-acetylase OafA/YrhL
MSYPVTKAGFLGVEFFFILAGVFMYKTANRPDSPGVFSWIVDKLQKFYFKIVVALVLTHMIYYEGLIVELHQNWLHPIVRFISELLMLQSIGSFEAGINCPTWFFATLIYGGALVYALTKYYTKFSIRIIFPFIAIFYFAYMFQNGTTESLENWDVIGFIPLSLVRGICEIGFGVVIGYVYFNYRDLFLRHLKALNMIAIVSLILYLAIIIDNRQFSQYALIFIPVLICTALTHGSVFCRLLRGKVCFFLGALSFDIFIIHYPLIAIFRHFLLVSANLPLWLVAVLYYISLIPAAYIYNMVSIKMKKMLFL